MTDIKNWMVKKLKLNDKTECMLLPLANASR